MKERVRNWLLLAILAGGACGMPPNGPPSPGSAKPDFMGTADDGSTVGLYDPVDGPYPLVPACGQAPGEDTAFNEVIRRGECAHVPANGSGYTPPNPPNTLCVNSVAANPWPANINDWVILFCARPMHENDSNAFARARPVRCAECRGVGSVIMKDGTRRFGCASGGGKNPFTGMNCK